MSLSLMGSMIRLSKASVVHGFFSFVPSLFSVQVRLKCPEILKSRHYCVFLVEVSFMGMIIEKDYKDFSAAGFNVLGPVFTLLLLCSPGWA